MLVLFKSNPLKKSVLHFAIIKYSIKSLNLSTTNFAVTSYIEMISFSSWLEDLAEFELFLRFFKITFNTTEYDVSEIVSVYIEDLERQIINLQSVMICKAHSDVKMFWNLFFFLKEVWAIYSYC